MAFSKQRRALPVAMIAAALAVVLAVLAAGHVQPASANCQGSGCLPGSGYTFDRTWDCGVIGPVVRCWYNATTSESSATQHTWGFGSAAYNGAGSVYVCVGTAPNYFIDCGTNLARGCYDSNCNDQDFIWFKEWVYQNTGSHTVWGHGLA